MFWECLFSRNSDGPSTSLEVDNLPVDLGDFYDTAMQRLIPDSHESLAWRVLELVVVARAPLHIELVQELVGCSDRERQTVLENLSTFCQFETVRYACTTKVSPFG